MTYRCAPSIEVTPELLAEVVGAVSQRSWQGTEGLAVYNEEANRTFYNLLCTVAQDLRLVLHSVTNSAGTPLAYVVAVRTAVVVHHVTPDSTPPQPTCHPAFATVEGVRWACEQGVTEIDLGIYAEYKERFGPRGRRGQRDPDHAWSREAHGASPDHHMSGHGRLVCGRDCPKRS